MGGKRKGNEIKKKGGCGIEGAGRERQKGRQREREREQQEDDRVVCFFQQRFCSFSLSPGDHPMLSCLSFKRGRLCQSSQIRKTEVAERLYLAWVKRRAPWEVKIGEGTAEPLCIPSWSFFFTPLCRAGVVAPLRLGVNGGPRGRSSRMTAS